MAVAVISEFNPFHNGHKYLVEQAKRLTNEPVIAVMSGSFTQRGEVAVTDKFSRAKTALENGVDLVVELPVVYAVASAQRFADCGVRIAKAFDCVNYLSFGCENDNIIELKAAAEALGNAEVRKIISAQMKQGCYYPRAVEAAISEVFGNKTAEIIRTPNNILAVEYLRSLGNCKIKPLPIMRKGTDHDSNKVCGELASASHIRSLLRSGENADKYLPSVPENITYTENLERILLYKLRMMKAEDFAKLPDVNEGLENRIASAVRSYNSVEEIISAVKTKRYTHARLRRIICCALLDITEKLQQTSVNYARILGFSKAGAELLKTCTIEIVTSAAKSVKKYPEIETLLKKDILAADIAALSYNKINSAGNDYTAQIIKV